MRTIKRITFLIFATIMLVMLFPVCGSAAGEASAGENRLSISYRNGEVPLRDVEFRLYLVAEFSQGNYQLTEDFAGYGIDLKIWDNLAGTLEGYVLRDQLAPAEAKKTDRNGIAEIKGMERGLYLVTGTYHLQDGMVYESVPFLVDFTSGTEEYIDLVTYPKYSSYPFEEETAQVTRKVLKVWDDKGREKDRPKEIEIQLLRDGVLHETVKLNEANNWRYTWEALDADHRWVVVERETERYTVSIRREGVTFVVTNTCKDAAGTPLPTPSKPPKLPQTGQTWWPVLLLAGLGVVLILAGLCRREDC